MLVDKLSNRCPVEPEIGGNLPPIGRFRRTLWFQSSFQPLLDSATCGEIGQKVQRENREAAVDSCHVCKVAKVQSRPGRWRS